MNIPQELQDKFVQFEQMRKQLQIVSAQRMQLEEELGELDETVNSLKGVKEDADVYKNAGHLMIKVEKHDELNEELKDRKETIELRVKTLRTQEERVKENFDSLQEELSNALSSMQGSNVQAQ